MPFTLDVSLFMSWQAFGTRFGVVFIVADMRGLVNQTIRVHKDSVTDIVIDSTGEYVVTCSDDGTHSIR